MIIRVSSHTMFKYVELACLHYGLQGFKKQMVFKNMIDLCPVNFLVDSFGFVTFLVLVWVLAIREQFVSMIVLDGYFRAEENISCRKHSERTCIQKERSTKNKRTFSKKAIKYV